MLRSFLRTSGKLVAGTRFCSMSNESSSSGAAINKLNTNKNVSDITDEEWKKVLSPEEYEVTRKAGTEPSHSGKYDKFFEKGRYICLCCGAELFNSDSKYWAGCGWPAFSKSIGEDMNIIRIVDKSYGMERTEVRCKKCNAHLGHVFDDGPKETGERYCINSVSMEFEPAK
ncbi:unnamed protein product [Auanema sp. JU1783]|nr:unnamed protein product [Auanema sp. JU1783]